MARRPCTLVWLTGEENGFELHVGVHDELVTRRQNGAEGFITMPGTVADEEVTFPVHEVRVIIRRSQAVCDVLDAQEAEDQAKRLTGSGD